jgi:hypothetical protein
MQHCRLSGRRGHLFHLAGRMAVRHSPKPITGAILHIRTTRTWTCNGLCAFRRLEAGGGGGETEGDKACPPKGEYAARHCHGNDCRFKPGRDRVGHAVDLLRSPPIPTRGHPACCLAVSAIHLCRRREQERPSPGPCRLHGTLFSNLDAGVATWKSCVTIKAASSTFQGSPPAQSPRL